MAFEGAKAHHPPSAVLGSWASLRGCNDLTNADRLSAVQDINAQKEGGAQAQAGRAGSRREGRYRR